MSCFYENSKNFGTFVKVSRETEPGSSELACDEQEPDEGGKEGQRPEESSGSRHAGM